MVPTCNGWSDMHPDEREALDIAALAGGYLILSAARRICQSMARITRTADKWKAMNA